MKALTISQPYASLIADGEKTIENRSWWTPYRGKLAIHAGKGTQFLTRQELSQYPVGCIIAVCKLNHVCRLNELGQFHPHLVDNEHANGPWCWVLTEIKRLDNPIVTRGEPGLWDFENRDWWLPWDMK